MDFNAITQMLNATLADGTNNHRQIPSLLIDTFLPGYGAISRTLSQLLGFNVTNLAYLCFGLLGLMKCWTYLGQTLPPLILDYITCSVIITRWDDLYQESLDWLAEAGGGRTGRDLVAKRRYGSITKEEFLQLQAQNSSELFHFAKWPAKIAPRYLPTNGSNIIFHNKWVYIFERNVATAADAKANSCLSANYEFLKIRTFGWSPAPIKSLIQNIQLWNCSKEQDETNIRMAKSSGGKDTFSWQYVTSRTVRPLETVVLDEQVKTNLVRDINNYLAPTAEKWYSSRGIPLRRGYLFYGPPGTGKSSLSFSVAGIFGLSIYVISLIDPKLTEDELFSLFQRLPKRCVVLLEDIDEAGLVRRDLDESMPMETQTTSTNSAGTSGKTDDREGGKKEEKKDNTIDDKITTTSRTSRITLSGLLNVIDGVAAHEGRILIMTSNCPDTLDPALIRPGRVDMQIGFTLATKSQAKDIFMRMYAPDSRYHPSGGTKENPTLRTDYATNLVALAEKFADAMPNERFSPAEVQGYLIEKRESPVQAVEGIGEWCDKQMVLKRKKVEDEEKAKAKTVAAAAEKDEADKAAAAEAAKKEEPDKAAAGKEGAEEKSKENVEGLRKVKSGRAKKAFFLLKRTRTA